MGHIFLVRHGEDEDNAHKILNGLRDKPLTERGREQALQVGEKLKDNNIDVIYSSPLKRAYATATIISETLGINSVHTISDLKERDFGILTGKPVADIPKYSRKTLQTDVVLYFLEAEGAEDFSSLLERGRRVLTMVKSKHPDENVLLVTHGDIGKMIRAAFHEWDWMEALKTPYFANTGVLELLPGADVIE